MRIDIEEILKSVFFIILFVAFVGFTIWGMNELNRLSCKKTAKELGYACQFSIWTDCILIKSDGSKILLDQLRHVEE